MSEKEFYTPTNDVIFHCLFGTKGQEKITKALLEGLLKRKVKKLDLDKNLNLIRTHHNDKLEIVDIRATDIDKNEYIIEMQNSENAFLAKRFLSYGCKAYIAEFKCSEDYKNLKKVVIVVIMMEKFPGLEKIDRYHTKYNLREELNPEIIITDDIEIHIFEMPKYLAQRKNGGEVEPWLEFIVNPNGEEVKEAMKRYKTIQEAVDELNRLNADDEVRELAFLQQLNKIERNSSIREAQEKGIQETTQNIAKRLLKLNIDIQIIMESTGLTKEEIENLKD